MADAGDEQGRVERRLAGECQHPTGLRLDGDHRTPAVAQRLLRDGLQITIQMQGQVPAGYRLGTLEHPQYATARVGFHLFIADLAMQQILIEALYPGLADIV